MTGVISNTCAAERCHADRLEPRSRDPSIQIKHVPGRVIPWRASIASHYFLIWDLHFQRSTITNPVPAKDSTQPAREGYPGVKFSACAGTCLRWPSSQKLSDPPALPVEYLLPRSQYAKGGWRTTPAIQSSLRFGCTNNLFFSIVLYNQRKFNKIKSTFAFTRLNFGLFGPDLLRSHDLPYFISVIFNSLVSIFSHQVGFLSLCYSLHPKIRKSVLASITLRTQTQVGANSQREVRLAEPHRV